MPSVHKSQRSSSVHQRLHHTSKRDEQLSRVVRGDHVNRTGTNARYSERVGTNAMAIAAATDSKDEKAINSLHSPTSP